MRRVNKTRIRLFWHPLVIGALALAANLAFAGETPSHSEWLEALTAEGKPITVFTAKKIYTMDPGRPEACAVAVLDGKVLSTEAVNPLAGAESPDLYYQQVTTRRVIRGGSWGAAAVNMRVTFRDSHPPDGAGDHVGFRCAYGAEVPPISFSNEQGE